MNGAVAQRIGDYKLQRPRTLDERAMVRFPGAYVRFAKRLLPASPRSRFRQRLLRHETLSGWVAINRDDYKLAFTRYAADVVYEFNPELVTLGLPPRVDGREQQVRVLSEFRASWLEWRFELGYILDLGERLVTLGHAFYRGRLSGADVNTEYAQLLGLRNALVQSERDFTSWPAAIAAAGLEANVLDRLTRLTPGAVAEV